MNKAEIGIIGASGYTGSELVRILVNHPHVSLRIITSETHKGKRISELHSHLCGICDHILSSVEEVARYDLDLVFLALPHGVSMNLLNDL